MSQSDGYIRVRLDSLKPAAINDKIYKPVSEDDAATERLVASIRLTKIVDPFAVTRDNVIVSGHRRRVACQVLGITEVDVKVLPIQSTDAEFETFLVNFNDQRVKTIDEQIREGVIRTSPDDARTALLASRAVETERSYSRAFAGGLRVLEAGEARRRPEISSAKRPGHSRCETHGFRLTFA